MITIRTNDVTDFENEVEELIFHFDIRNQVECFTTNPMTGLPTKIIDTDFEFGTDRGKGHTILEVMQSQQKQIEALTDVIKQLKKDLSNIGDK